MLLACNVSAQFLSFPECKVITILKKNNIPFTIDVNKRGYDVISVCNVGGANSTYEFHEDDLCHKETITPLSDNSVIDLLMDLDKKHYIQFKDVYWHEEDYGIVQVERRNNTFIFEYEK